MIVFRASVFSTAWSFFAALAYSLGALLVRQITGVPIKFAGAGEKIDDLEAFDAEQTMAAKMKSVYGFYRTIFGANPADEANAWLI